MHMIDGAHFVQTGYGRPGEDLGMGVGLDKYCMGGPGVVLNWHALDSFAKVIRGCLRQLETDHEDVEVGRCLAKHNIASCTSAVNANSVFLNLDAGKVLNFDSKSDPQGG